MSVWEPAARSALCGVVEHGDTAREYPAILLVLVPHAIFAVELVRFASQVQIQVRSDSFQIIGMNAIEPFVG